MVKTKSKNKISVEVPGREVPSRGICSDTAIRKNPSPRARILLVDDDDLLREFIAETLIWDGYHVVCAKDGEDGWDSLCKLEFDLLITDHNMPRLSGLELIQRIKERPSRPSALMITGYVPLHLVGSAAERLDFEVLAKPFLYNELLQKIASLLESREA